MLHRSSRALRSLLAVALFATSGGGEQLLDALAFHTRTAPVEQVRVNAGDHCHAEQCELGMPIATTTPIDSFVVDGRFEPPIHRLELDRPPAMAPSAPSVHAHAPRAPPRNS